MNKKVPISKSSESKAGKNKGLSRREREVVDLLFSMGTATVGDVQRALSDQPSYAATRMVLQRLHKKGELEVSQEGKKYLYRTVTPKEKAGLAALRSLLETFFRGSATSAVSALLGDRQKVSDAEIEELEALIRKAKAERAQEP